MRLLRASLFLLVRATVRDRSSSQPTSPHPVACSSQPVQRLLHRQLTLLAPLGRSIRTVYYCSLLSTVASLSKSATSNPSSAHYPPFDRILIFQSKAGDWKALVQLPSVEAGQRVKVGLDGREMFEGCNRLEVEYSEMSELHIGKPSDKAQDYTLARREADGTGAGW